MPTRTSIKALIAFSCLTLPFALTAQTSVQTSPTTPSMTAPSHTSTSREEILKTFQREADAAYARARKECQVVTDEQEQKVCLAKARLQFDADMRYAEKRADMGY